MIDDRYISGSCPYCGYSRSGSVEDDEYELCPWCGSESFDGYCYDCGYPDNPD